MLTTQAAPFRLTIQDAVGLSHDPQVVTVDLPPGLPENVALRDSRSGVIFPVQRSRQSPGRAFVLLGLEALGDLELSASQGPQAPADPVRRQVEMQSLTLSNARLAVELPWSETPRCDPSPYPAGPVGRFRSAGSVWRGRTFFDTRAALVNWQTRLLEDGPVRTAVEYSALFADGGSYRCVITLDSGQTFAQIDEYGACGLADQLVWDFAGDDCPSAAWLVERTPGERMRPVQYHYDERIARLASWNQQSQIHDFYDGFAFGYEGSADVIGCVALEVGDWRGGRLNHLEAWARRWVRNDPASRRGLAPEAKADSLPSPEIQPALRVEGRSAPHLCWEGWLGGVRRCWALVACDRAAMIPPPQNTPWMVGEQQPQGLLKRLHVQRGIMPLEAMLSMCFTWPAEASSVEWENLPEPLEQWKHFTRDEVWRLIRERVVQFWTQGGAGSTNPVNSRTIAPAMYAFEAMVRRGELAAMEMLRFRAQFAMLACLFARESYYPGDAVMLAADDPDALEPTVAGMPNQNFYTDIITLVGTAGQVFDSHPSAEAFRRHFTERWRRQLAAHVYPASGVWEESHTYCHHVLLTVLPLLGRRRQAGLDDAFATREFQSLARGLLRQISPPDACYGGRRHVVPLGDHGVDTRQYACLYKVMAEGFAPHDSDLAGQLAWAYREMGGSEPLAVRSIPPTWRDEWVQGLGYFFRTSDCAGRQSLLVLRAGSAWGHHHNDEGSLLLYARGQALVVDAAMGSRQPSSTKHLAAGHSAWALADHETQSYLWRFTRGWICRHGLAGPFAFATAYCPRYMVPSALPRPRHLSPSLLSEPVLHYRTVVRLGAGAYLILDAAQTRLDQVVRFHVPGIDVRMEGLAATATCLDGTLLHVTPLTPTSMKLSTAVHSGMPENQEDYQIFGQRTSTQLSYRTGTTPVSAFLLAAVDGDVVRPPCQCLDGIWHVAVDDIGVQVELTPEVLRLGVGPQTWDLSLRPVIESRG